MTTPDFEQLPSEPLMVSRSDLGQFHDEEMEKVNTELAGLEALAEGGFVANNTLVPVRNESGDDFIDIPYGEAVARATGKLIELRRLTAFILDH